MPPRRPGPGTTLLALVAAVVAAASTAHAFIEVVRETGCQDAQMRLICRNLEATIAVLEARFSPDAGRCAQNNAMPAAASSSLPATLPAPASQQEDELELRSPYVVRPALNRRCSGGNTCSFVLTEDCPDATSWGPGRLDVKYACADPANVTRTCGGVLLADGGGAFLQTPAYPAYYVGQLACHWTLRAPPGKALRLSLLDVSLRGGEPECRDVLRVSDGGRQLLEACGEQAALQRIQSGRDLTVSVLTTSKTLYTRRGVLMHYTAVGCGEPPPAPVDGYRVTQNATHALYMCCVGHAFADTHEREQVLRCDGRSGSWMPAPLPECVNATFNPWTAMRLNAADNDTSLESSPVPKDSDLMIDVLLPTMIICVLLLGNGVIIFVILYLRKRKLPDGADDELGAICQPQDTGSVSV